MAGLRASCRLGCTSVLVLCAGTCVAVSGTARASVLTWANLAGGSAGTAGNWSPNQVPTAADDLTFALNGTYTVTWSQATVPTSRTHVYRGGTVTGVFAGHTVTSQLYVGQLTGNNATLVVNGVLHSTNFVTLGRDGGATGVMNFANSGSRLDVAGATFDAIVGQAGTGTVNLLNGSVLQVLSSADDLIVGNLVGGVGLINMQGAGAQTATAGTANPSGGDVLVGVSGTGTINVGNQSSLFSANDLWVGLNAGSSGTINVADTTNSSLARVQAARDVHIGHNSTITAAGAGTMTLGAGSEVQAATVGSGTTFVGDANGGSGTLNINGGLFVTKGLVVDPTNGHLNLTGGELRIDTGGSYTSNEVVLLSSAARPLLRFSGSSGTLTSGFILGAGQLGQMIIERGAVVSAVPGPGSQALMLGLSASSNGSMTVTGVGSRLDCSGILTSFIVGSNGRGSLTVDDHGVLNTQSPVTVAASPGSVGNLTVSTSGRLACTGDMVLGNSGGAATATARFLSSADVRCRSLSLHPGSSLLVDDSTVTCVGSVVLSGPLALSNGGELAGTAVTVNSTVTGAGNLFGNVTVNSAGVISAVGGDLFLGSPSNSGAGFSNAGTLNVGAATVHILDGNAAAGGVVSLSGGHLIAPNGLTFGTGNSVSGTGMVTGAVSLGTGVSIAPAGAAGLTFNGVVSGSAIAANGTRVLLAAGSGLVGAGTVHARVQTEEGANIDATGNLTMGDNSQNGAINLQGELQVGASTVELQSHSPALLGTRTSLAGGRLLGPADVSRSFTIGTFPFQIHRTVFDVVPVLLNTGSVLGGTGFVECKLRTAPGSRVAPSGPMVFVGSGTPLVFPNTILDNGNRYAPWEGDLDAAGFAVTFQGEHVMGGTTTLSNGSVTADELSLMGVVTGEGVLAQTNQAQALTNGGVIRPGGARAGRIVVRGGFANDVDPLVGHPGTLELDVGGGASGEEFDQLVVTGGAVLRGTLNVGLIDGPAEPGFEYPIITCLEGRVSGEFTDVNLPPGMVIEYRSTEVVVYLQPCYADFNQDGGIDGGDVDAFFAAWEEGDAAADVNLDGGVDGADVDTFFAAWEAGGCG